MKEHNDESPAVATLPRQNPLPAPLPLSYSVKGAMAASGLGRSTIFQLMADGRLERVKVGKRTLIPRASLESLLTGAAA
jgi:excisionase family DNA binding protein